MTPSRPNNALIYEGKHPKRCKVCPCGAKRDLEHGPGLVLTRDEYKIWLCEGCILAAERRSRGV